MTVIKCGVGAICAWGPLVVAWGDGIAWFRLFGVGLSWTDHRKVRPRLSERYSGQHGFRRQRYLHVGPHCLIVTTARRP